MIKLGPLRGLVPRLEGFNNLGQAQQARDIDFSSGYLKPWCCPLLIDNIGDKQSIHIKDGKYKCADSSTRFVDGEICGMVYESTICDCPKVHKDWCSDDDPIYLGMPKPATPEVLSSDTNNPDDLSQYVAFTIRYVNNNCPGCPEGPASQPSIQIKCNKDDQIQVRIPAPVDDKYEYTHVKIYRTQTTWDVSQGMHEAGTDGFVGNNPFGGFETAVDAACFCIEEIPINGQAQVRTYDCSMPCGELLVGIDNYPPPDGLCIVGETTSGSMVGVKDDCLLFSCRNAYHAWPTEGYMTLGEEIDTACVVGDRVFVLTRTGKLYLVLDNIDGTEVTQCRTTTMLRKTSQLAGCKSDSHKKSYCDHTGFTWIGTEGIMRASLDGNVVNMTWPWFGFDEWKRTDPRNMTLAQYRSTMFFSSPVYSGVLDANVRGEIISEDYSANHSTLSICPDCWISDCDDNLYFISDGCLWQFNAGLQDMQMRYRSTWIGQYGMYSSARFDFVDTDRCTDTANGGVLCIYADGKLVDTRKENGRTPFRFRRRRAHDVSLEYIGSTPLRGICVGASLQGLLT